MGFGARLRAGAVAAGIVVLIAGCTSSTADGPTTTRLVTITGTPSAIDPSPLMPGTSAPPSGPSPSVVETSPPASPDPAAQEAADRAAIEAQWIELWDIYTRLARIPAADRPSTLTAVTTSPLTEKLLDAANQADIEGVDNYGEVGHRIFWQVSVAGGATATIADCQDQSQAGTVRVSTGETLTTGRSRINLRGDFVKEDDGIWRARQIVDLGNSDC